MSDASPDVLGRVRVSTAAVHNGLLSWVRRLLRESGQETLQVHSQFLPKGSTIPFVAVFPYRMGPEPGLVNTARPTSLLGGPPDRRPGSTGIPEPWGQVGRFLTDALALLWPKVPRPGSDKPVLASASSITTLTPALAAWYRAHPDWMAPGPLQTARIPTLWWAPGITTAVHYLIGGNAAAAGTSEEGDATPALLGALAAVIAGVHHQQGFDVRVPAPASAPPLAEFCRAIASDLDWLAPPAAPDLATALRDAALALEEGVVLRVSVSPTQDLNNAELFSLMQALERTFQSSTFLKVDLRIGDLFWFAPGSEPMIRFVHEEPK